MSLKGGRNMKGARLGLSRRRNPAFTLIELLVVVAIILVLTGIALRIMSLVNRKAGTAATLRVLEQVKNALGAYYSTYGTYPPVTSVAYIYEKTPMKDLPDPPDDMGWRTGLVYFIYSGDHHNPYAQRWQHYLEGIGGFDILTNAKPKNFVWNYWTNNLHSIWDAWDSELRYECLPPYSTYRLWSIGPNRNDNNGGGDDLGVAPTE
jgi:prepilin-type N-terminal cleavage/methylation domain-containing protein